MKSIKYVILFLLITLFVFSQTVYMQKNASDKDLPNFCRISANFYRGAQPTEDGIKKLKQMGVKTIINLRGDDEYKTEERWANAAGIKFINVNLSNWFKPKTGDIERIIKEIDTAENQPIFIHCKRGADRTGTVVAVYRITHDGWTSKQALDEAKEYRIGWWQVWMKDYINDYYRDFQKRKSGEISDKEQVMRDKGQD